jgi:hypothetical protein
LRAHPKAKYWPGHKALVTTPGNTGKGRSVKTEQDGMRIALQVGSELRIKNNGEVIVDNPELELAADARAADAVLSYRFDQKRREHILRLVEPTANHKHLKVHRADD